jgi:hypothetical protein
MYASIFMFMLSTFELLHNRVHPHHVQVLMSCMLVPVHMQFLWWQAFYLRQISVCMQLHLVFLLIAACYCVLYTVCTLLTYCVCAICWIAHVTSDRGWAGEGRGGAAASSLQM